MPVDGDAAANDQIDRRHLVEIDGLADLHGGLVSDRLLRGDRQVFGVDEMERLCVGQLGTPM